VTDNGMDSAAYERLRLPKEWSDAIDALQAVRRVGLGWEYTGKHNLMPLAKMLNSGEPVPPYVAKIISIHLAPPKGRWCGKLRYEPPPPRAINFWKKKRRERNAKIDIENLCKGGEKYETAINIVAEKNRRSKSWARNLPPIDDDRDIAEAMRRLDPSNLLP